MHKFFSYTFLTVMTVDLLATSGEFSLTWTSPILPKLHSNNSDVNPMDRPITSSEESWIGSLINIGAIIGPLPFGILSEKLGRKMTLLSIAVPYIISYTILALMQHLYWYYAARLLIGISLGAACSILPVYIAEIAEDSNRGMLSVTLNIFWTFGDLVPYVLGPYMPILSFNLTLACIPVIFFVLFIIMAPESPYFLIGKGEISKAEESLMKLRSRSRKAVEIEIETIKLTIDQNEKGSFFEIFETRASIKALIISLALITFQELSGINAVLFYTEMIFEMSGSDVPADISSIIIGVVLFISSMITPLFANRFGRRVFLLISSITMMISLAVLGAYFFLKENIYYDVTLFNWLPILTLVSFIIGFNIGFASLPWTVSSELFPVKVKAIGTSLVSLTCFLGSFIITKFFNDLNDLCGKAGTFWIFGSFCFAATLFVVFFVPETKGKSFKEIQDLLEK